MPKYLIAASYTQEGIAGVLRGGGSARREAVGRAISAMGGTMESFHFAFGDDDAYVVAELPDNVAAAALGMAVSASGTARTRTIVLLSPEEIDRASRVDTHYRAPSA